MAGEVAESMALMDQMGVFSFILPFILIFVVVYAILEKTNILADEGSKSRKAINATTSFVIALFSLYFSNLFGVGEFLSYFLTRSSLVIVVVVIALALTTFIIKTVQTNKLVSDKDLDRARAATFFFTTGFVLTAISNSPQAKEILLGTAAGNLQGTSMLMFLVAFFIWWVR
jgi:magnesium-transporting ATPase (P-type)